MTEITTRDAIAALNQFLREDAARRAELEDLDRQLAAVIDARRASFDEIQSTLDAYAQTQFRAHGFDLDRESDKVVKVVKVAKAKTIKKKVSKKKRKTKKVAKKQSRTAVAAGWPGVLDSTINYSPMEFEVVERMKERYPEFVNVDDLGGNYTNNTLAATVYRLRRKGVPVESAQSVRESGREVVSLDATGYRLIS